MQISFFFLLFLLLTFATAPVFAGKYPNPLGSETFPDLIRFITGNLIPIAEVLAVATIVFVGFRFVAAAISGNPQELAKARKTFWWVLIGTAITIGAYAIAGAVVDFFGKK